MRVREGEGEGECAVFDEAYWWRVRTGWGVLGGGYGVEVARAMVDVYDDWSERGEVGDAWELGSRAAHWPGNLAGSVMRPYRVEEWREGELVRVKHVWLT